MMEEFSELENEKMKMINLSKNNADVLDRMKKMLDIINTIEESLMIRASDRINKMNELEEKLQENINLLKTICQNSLIKS